MNQPDQNGNGIRRTALGRAIYRRIAALRGDTGSTAEAIASVVLSVAIIGIIAGGAVSSSGALGTASSNAERTQHLNILTGDPAADMALDKKWRAATTSAFAEPANLPSGVPPINAYLWSKTTATGVQYSAAMPRSGNTTEMTKCNNVTTSLTDLCVYSSSFHANDFRKSMPPVAAGFTTADLTKTIPARSQIAAAQGPSSPSSYRFFLSAAAIGAAGTVEVAQNGTVIAIIPITTTTDDYFGTVDLAAGGTVTFKSPDRVTSVTKVLIYKAGS
jgi:hypothetical protein